MDLFSFMFGVVTTVAVGGVAIFVVALRITVKKMRALEGVQKK